MPMLLIGFPRSFRALDQVLKTLERIEDSSTATIVLMHYLRDRGLLSALRRQSHDQPGDAQLLDFAFPNLVQLADPGME
jgi:hypothetical protein